MTAENAWTAFKQLVAAKFPLEKVLALFEDNAAVRFVPSGTMSLRDAVQSYLESADQRLETRTLSIVETPFKIVEESVVTFIHDREIQWLLPGVRPTNRRLVAPMVFVATLGQSGLFTSINIHWDQGSLLRQIGTLPNSLFCKANSSETVLPVQGVRIADGLIEDSEKFTRGESYENVQVNRIYTTFNVQEQEQVSYYYEEAQAKAAMNLTANSDAAFREPQRPRASNISNVFNSEPFETKAPMKKIPISSIFNDAVQDVARPSIKLHQPSGGYSHNIFGSENAPIKTSIAVNPDRNRSQIDFKVEEAGRRPLSRRDPNYLSMSEVSLDEFKPSKRLWGGKATESQFSLGQGNYQEPAQSLHTSKRMGVNSNESHFSYGNAALEPEYKHTGRRDPNEQSIQQDVQVRASSRVLRPPGGGSSLVLG